MPGEINSLTMKQKRHPGWVTYPIQVGGDDAALCSWSIQVGLKRIF